MQPVDIKRWTMTKTTSNPSLRSILRKGSPSIGTETNLTPRNHSPISFKEAFSPKTLPFIPTEINWQKWKKDEKFIPSHPVTTRQLSRKTSTGDLHGTELAQERLETRGVQSMRQISTRGSPSNSVDRKIRAAEFITTLRDSCLRKNYSSSEFVLAERSDVKRAFKALEFIAQEESLYADLMKNTLQILKLSLFFQKGIVAQFSEYWDRIESEELKKVIANYQDSKLTLPYLSLCVLLLKEVRLKDEKHGSTVSYYERLVACKSQP